MKSKFAAFALLFATVLTMASCLKGEDDYTYTDDSAITSFSVTTAKQNKYVKTSDGLRDSLVTTELTLSSYKFYIDQLKGEIYNPDSLPCGVDAKKLLCSLSSQNSGVVAIKSATSDSLKYFSTTDSTDFTIERELQVVSNSGQAVRKYKVHVNVHKEWPDSFAWHATADCQALIGLTAIRTVAVANGLLLFGTDGNETKVFANNGTSWKACTTNRTLAADAYKGVVVKDGYAYMSDGGDIVRSADGANWTATGTSTDIARLVAASSFRIYGYNGNGQIMESTDDGTSWTQAQTDEALTLLPTAETAYTCSAISGYKQTERVLLIGTRDATTYPDDKNLTIWYKIDEGAEYSENQPWAYNDVSATNKYAAPMLSNISAVPYDGCIYVLGKKTDTNEPALYKSVDNGLTWNTDTTVTLPADLALNSTLSHGIYALTVDKNNSLWIVNARNGKTWRGRINRLGWKKEQTVFEK